tara:strand:- start:5863 stop:6666 length:804 start_codon:yes stop_codon:yes gene_type:complete
LKNIFLLLVLFFLSACAELNLVNHISKKVINTSKNEEDNTIYKKEKEIIPYYKVGNPYSINGIQYIPKEDPDYFEEGIASWYGPKFDGKLTANGEIFDQYAVTAAHRTLPIPSLVKVTNLENNRSIVIRINDRGPFVGDRIIDLSYKSAQLLGIIQKGTGKVRVEVIDYGEHLLVKNSKKLLKTNVKQNKEYFLQVGVFKEASNADRLSDKLRNTDYINYKVFTNTVNINDRILYIVKIGPIQNNENIKYVQRKLKNNKINTKVIIE